MKNILPYLAGLLVAALIVLVIVSANRNGPKKFDQRVTLRQQDKIPYGTSVAKRLRFIMTTIIPVIGIQWLLLPITRP